MGLRLQGQGYVLVPLQPPRSARKAVTLDGAVYPALDDGNSAQHGALWAPFSELAFVPQSMPAYMPPVASSLTQQSTFTEAGVYAVDTTFQHSVDHLFQVPAWSNEQLPREVLTLPGSLPQPFPLSDYINPCEPHVTVHCQDAIKESEHLTRGLQTTKPALEPAKPTLGADFGQPVTTVCPAASLEFQVKNTFINIVLPSSPSAHASRRTQSCPRSMR